MDASIRGVFVYLVVGPTAFSVTAMVEGGPAPEAEAEAIAEIILHRLANEPAAAAGDGAATDDG